MLRRPGRPAHMKSLCTLYLHLFIEMICRRDCFVFIRDLWRRCLFRLHSSDAKVNYNECFSAFFFACYSSLSCLKNASEKDSAWLSFEKHDA